MAPTLLFDIEHVDLDRPRFDVAAIEQVNPHRGEMRLLDAVAWVSEDHAQLVAYRDVGEQEFWVPGHIPGQPVFPGVLMIEAAAQLASFSCLRRMPDQQFMGFVGVDRVRFRGQVLPGDRFVMLCQQLEFRRRRCVCTTQGLVDGELVFEGTITGMPMTVQSRAVSGEQ